MSSTGERKIVMLLDEGEINYIREYSFPDLKSARGVALRFDFAIFHDEEYSHLAFLIEYNGEQHYKQKFQTKDVFARQQANDKKKIAYCRAKNIPLVIIPFTDYHEMSLESILEEGQFFN